MVCKHCSNEIAEGMVVCPFCGNQIEEDQTEEKPKKKKKKGLKIFLIVFGVIVLIPVIIVLISYLMFAFSEEPVVSALSVQNDEIYLGQENIFTVSYANESGFARTQEFEILVDGNLYEREVVDFEDDTTANVEYVLNDLSIGTHKINVGEYNQEFEVVKYNQFDISCEEIDLMVKDIPKKIYYRVSNLGTYEGEFDINIIADGKSIVEKSVFLERGDIYDDSFDIVSSNDNVKLSVNGQEQTIKVYEPTNMENGQKLMDNTVKGYGYFVVINDSANDLVYYIVEKDNPDVAVSAVYIEAGKTYELRSFPHGTYQYIVQTGKHWVSELNAFADQYYIIRDKEDIVFKNNVDKVYGGTYTYWTITLVDDLDEYTDYVEILDTVPTLGK